MSNRPESNGAFAGAHLGNVCVLGLGKTGIEVARYLAGLIGSRVDSVTLFGGAKSSPSALSTELEAAGVRVAYGTERVDGTFDLAIVSPGIPVGSGFFLSAQEHAAQVIGEPEFAWRESPQNWIAITGTNGKTTTTLLTCDLLCTGSYDALSVGNVGTVVTSKVTERKEGSWFVTELSSFQLMTAYKLHPRVACLLNVTPDHLEWHGTMEDYALAKERVFQNMGAGDLAVISCEDEWCRRAIRNVESRGVRTCYVAVHEDPGTPCAAFVRNGKLVVRLDQKEYVLVSVESLAIRGDHNVQNALAASACALEVGAPKDAVCHGLLVFHPLEHRIESCGTVGGVRYVDDSKATNVDAVVKALTAFVPGKVIVLLGGHDKGTELSQLAHAVSARCKAAVCYGEAGERIAQALEHEDGDMGLKVARAEHMADAVMCARAIAESGDVVLLSPACSSFDEFASYRARGDAFKDLVAAIVADSRQRP